MKPKITIILNLILFSSITYCQPGKVLSYQRITYKVGNFNLPPDSVRNLGWNNCLLGDLNGDGKKEIFSISSGSHGHGYIFSLNTDGTVYQPRIIGRNKGLLDNATSTWYDFGSSCANIGDIDRDGITDLAIGNSGESGYGGDVFIIMLNSNGSIKNYKVLAAGKNGFNATLGTNDKFGASIISLGDIDKNKTTELVIGAPFTSDGASQAGAIWILSIDSTGFCTEYQKISHTTGGGNVLNINSNFTRFGSSSSKYTDIDGDQIPEFLVGAPNARYYGVAQGKFYGVSITSTKTIKAFKIISDTSQNFGDTILNPCTLSTSIGNIGDIDGNGFEDIALSTSYQGGILKRGLAKVLLMQNNFRIKSNILWDSLQNGIPAYDMFASFGFGLTGLGDINKDGRLDALVGIPGENKVQGSYGSCYVLFLDGKINFYNPIALFNSSKDTIKINECVNFTDLSSNTPTNWKWIFAGGNPPTSTQQHPSNICFGVAGKYPITLIAVNSKGSDTATKTLVVQDPAAAEKINYLAFKIIPNPFSNSTIIQTDKFLKDAILNIYNATGQLIKQTRKISGQNIIFNRDDLPNGIYFIHLTDCNKINIISKFIITN